MPLEKVILSIDSKGFPVATVKIKDFKTKMKTWRPTQEITTELFCVQGLPLQLMIKPNGHTARFEGNVSVFLVNKSTDDLQAEFVLKMKDVEQIHKVEKPSAMKPTIGWGSATLFCHKGLKNVGSDESNKIVCTIIELKRDVSTVMEIKIENSTNELKRKCDYFESKLEEGATNLEKRIARFEAKIESKLEATSEGIKLKIDDTTKSNNNVTKPKCPICFEDMSSKIAQCISGHLLCWGCKEKMGGTQCAFCDQPVNGRAFGMEAYLRTIFG